MQAVINDAAYNKNVDKNLVKSASQESIEELGKRRQAAQSKVSELSESLESLKQVKSYVDQSDLINNSQQFLGESSSLSKMTTANTFSRNRIMDRLNSKEELVNKLRAEARQLKVHLDKSIKQDEKELDKAKKEREEIKKELEVNPNAPHELAEKNVIIINLQRNLDAKKELSTNIQKAITPEIVPTVERQETSPLQKPEPSVVQTIMPNVEVVKSEELPKPDRSVEIPRSESQPAAEVQPQSPAPDMPDSAPLPETSKEDPKSNAPEDNASKPGPEKTDEPKPGTSKEADKIAEEAPNARIPENKDLKPATEDLLKAVKELAAVRMEKNKEVLAFIPQKVKHVDRIKNLEADNQKNQSILQLKISPDTDLIKFAEKYLLTKDDMPEGKKIEECLKDKTNKVKEQIKNTKEIDNSDLKKEMLPHSKKMRWARRLFHLWPLAMIPLCMAVVMTMLPAGSMVVLYATPMIAATVTAAALTYYVPKLINYARKKRQNHLQKKIDKAEFDKAMSQTREYSEPSKEQSVDKNQEVAHTEPAKGKEETTKEKDGTTKEESLLSKVKGIDQAADPVAKGQNLSRKEKVAAFFKKNWKTLAIIGAVTIGVAAGGLFLFPALFPSLTVSVAVGGLFTVGSLAVAGAGLSIGAQLLDKFGLKKAENHLAKKEEKTFVQRLDQNIEKIQENSAVLKEVPVQVNRKEPSNTVQQTKEADRNVGTLEKNASIPRTSELSQSDRNSTQTEPSMRKDSLSSIDYSLFEQAKSRQSSLIDKTTTAIVAADKQNGKGIDNNTERDGKRTEKGQPNRKSSEISKGAAIG